MKRNLAFLFVLVLSVLFCTGENFAQVTIYGPINFGSGAPAVTSVGDSIGIHASGWTSDPVLAGTSASLVPGAWGANSQSVSTGYTGASGTNNADVENRVVGTYPTGAHLMSPSINTSLYTSIEAKFGRRFSGAANAFTVTVSYSTDGGANFVTTGLSGNTITHPGASTWAQVTVTGFPAVSSLILRWTASGFAPAGSQNFRIDDVEVTGISTVLSDGDGSATLANSAGTLNGSQVFQRNTGSQTVVVTVTGVSLGNLDKVKLTVPATWSTFSSGNVSLGGALSSGSLSVVGNDITVNSAALGTTPGTITITGLTSANPTGALNNGNDTWVVQTAKLAGTLTNIAVSPKSYTTIPIQNMRTGGTDGFGNSDAGGVSSAMNGQTVALDGIATVENQIISSSATQTSFFLQDGGYGVQIFRSAAPSTAFARGDQIVLKGIVGGFNGSMQVSPPTGASPDFFNLGAGSLPTPLVVANPNSLTEQHEGKLVRVNTVTFDSAGLGFTATVGARNSFRTSPTDTGTVFLTSTNTIVGSVIPDTASVVGIVYHRTDISGAMVPPYKLAARDLADIISIIADGSGTAALTNASGGTYNGSTVFPRNSASQTVSVSVTGVSSGTLDQVRLTVPATWSGFSAGNVTLGGAFSGSPSVVGNDITIGSAALGTTPGTITISGLTSPDPVGAGLSGNDQWLVKTAATSGTLTNLLSSPSSHTIIPISNLRAGGTDGYGNSDAGGTTPVLSGTTVAVQGVITVPNRVLAETTTTSIIIQDGTFGLQVFRSSTQSHTTLLKGNLITVKGPVGVFNGNTEILPASVTTPNIFNLGAGTLPAPQVLSNALAIAESTEARLVKLNSVNWDSAGQPFAVSASSTSDNNFDGQTGTVFIHTANNIDGTPIPVSSPIVGVVYHRTDWVGGGQQVYKIAPRNLLDLAGAGVSIAAGWNMVSNPVVAPSDSVLQLYPTSFFSYAFAFNPTSGYQQDQTMENGTGYWAKFPSAITQSVSGSPLDSVSTPLAQGWNMIGSISSTIDDSSSQVSTVPASIISSHFFGYSAGYSNTRYIDPGKAYWVKSNAPGTLFMNASAAPANRVAAANPLDGFSTITVTDAAGGSQTLYLGYDRNGSFPVESFEMPPVGPEGTFDTRFESGRMVEVSRDGKATQHAISIRSTAYPLTVSWNVAGGKLMLSDGVNPAKAISGSGETIIRNPSVNRLVVSTQGTEVPVVFSLQQNYPNPFNPATTIRFGIPSNSKVTLRVYNILGQQVAEVLNGVLESGYHEAIWEARTNAGSQVSSGVYFYKLEASSLTTGQTFSEVHKMVLMK